MSTRYWYCRCIKELPWAEFIFEEKVVYAITRYSRTQVVITIRNKTPQHGKKSISILMDIFNRHFKMLKK